MRPSSIALLLGAAIALCAAAPAQSVVSSKLVIGDGVSSRGSSPALTQPDQGAFDNALQALGGPGPSAGSIEVMPGTYTFGATVELAQAGVRISGGPNAVLRLDAGFMGPLFSVDGAAQDCVLDGLTLLFEGDAADTGGRVLLDVFGQGFTLTNCRVVVSTAGDAPQDSAAVRIAGVVGTYGTLIEGNTFLAGRLDDPEGDATPVDAPGWTFLSSSGGRNLRVLGNDFRSGRTGQEETPVRIRNAILLVDDEWTTIVGNTFAQLESSGATAGPASALVGSGQSDPVEESNHLTFTGNHVSDCPGPSNLSLEGNGHSAITANAFDRSGSHADGTIQLLGNIGDTVSGNVFTNLGAVAGPSLRCANGTSVCVQGNSFLVPDEPGVDQTGPQVVFEGEEGPLLSGNQFSAPAGTAAQVRLWETHGGSVVGNRFETLGCQPLEFESAGALEVFVCSNLLRLLDGGCAPPAWTASGYTVRECDDSSGNPGF